MTLLLHLLCEPDMTVHACNKRKVTFFLFLGVIHLSAYLKSYKVGDIVDIKVILHLVFFFQGSGHNVSLESAFVRIYLWLHLSVTKRSGKP